MTQVSKTVGTDLSTQEFLDRAARGSRNVDAIRAELTFRLGLIVDAMNRSISQEALREWVNSGQMVRCSASECDDTMYKTVMSPVSATGYVWAISGFGSALNPHNKPCDILTPRCYPSGEYERGYSPGAPVPFGMHAYAILASLPELLDLVEKTFPGVKQALAPLVDVSYVYDPL